MNSLTQSNYGGELNYKETLEKWGDSKNVQTLEELSKIKRCSEKEWELTGNITSALRTDLAEAKADLEKAEAESREKRAGTNQLPMAPQADPITSDYHYKMESISNQITEAISNSSGVGRAFQETHERII